MTPEHTKRAREARAVEKYAREALAAACTAGKLPLRPIARARESARASLKESIRQALALFADGSTANHARALNVLHAALSKRPALTTQ
jgi:hypothetical protein